MDRIAREARKDAIERLQRVAPLGSSWRKKSGSEWSGRVVGYYSTGLNPQGLCIESEMHAGSVQIYPISALEMVMP